MWIINTHFILKGENLHADKIINRVLQDIIDYTPEKNAYSDLGNFIARTSPIRSELAGSFSCDFSEDGSAGDELMAKLLFLKYSRELKGELILLCGSRISTLSSLLRDTGKAIKYLMIKGGGFARWSWGTDWGSLKGTSPKSGGTETQWGTSFQLVLDFWATWRHYNNLPPIIFVTFGRERRIVSLNCLLDIGSSRTYLSGGSLQSLAPSIWLDSIVIWGWLPCLWSVTKGLKRWFWMFWGLVVLSTLLSWWPTSWTYPFS